MQRPNQNHYYYKTYDYKQQQHPSTSAQKQQQRHQQYQQPQHFHCRALLVWEAATGFATTPKHTSAKTTTTTPTQSQRYRENNKNNNKNLSLNYVLVSPSCAPFHPLPPSFSIYAYRQLYTDDQKPPIVIMLLSSPKVY
jgi:hypothetical protein